MKATPLTRRILHAACRQGAPRSENFSGAFDWKDIVDRAWRLGVITNLQQLVRERLPYSPAEVQQRLAALQLRQAADAVMIHEQLRETLATFQAAGIQVIVLKGAALALGVYQNVAARPMRDLDLLVREEQLTAADEALTEQGYRPDEFYRPRDWWIEHHHHLIPLVREGRPVPIELHRDLVPPSSGIVTDLTGLWKRAESASVAGIPTLVLSRVDLLLHLCQHLDRLMGRLGSLRDIAEVIGAKKGDVDWGAFTAAATQSGAASRAYCALKLARSVTGASVPGEVLDALRRAGGFTRIEEVCLDAIAERALTWTDDGGFQTAYLSDCGSALLGGRSMKDRVFAAARALRDRVAAFRRGRAAQPAMAEPT